MKTIILALVILGLQTAIGAEFVETQYRQVDLLGLDVVQHSEPNQICARAWFVTRDAIVGPTNEPNALFGSYGESISARPLGVRSTDSGCKYKIKGDNGQVYDDSMWALFGRRTPGGQWRIIANPMVRGELQKSDERNITVTPSTSSGGSKMSVAAAKLGTTVELLPVPSVAAADIQVTTLVDTTIRRMAGNGCRSAAVEVETLRNSASRIDAACLLYRKLKELSGGVAAVTIDSVERFSRQPLLLPAPGVDGPLTEGEGALVSYTMTLASSDRLGGHMLLVKENAQWHVSSLW